MVNLIRMKYFFAVSTLALMSEIIYANELSPNNVVLWEKSAGAVGNFSVVPKPACDGGLELSLDNKVISADPFQTTFRGIDSRDGKYWIVTSTITCPSASSSCLSAQALTIDHTVLATMKCWKYKGLTISMGGDGELHFDSDSPIEQQAIRNYNSQAK